jgi:putative oxidoreductase
MSDASLAATLLVAGRVLVGALFVVGGVRHFFMLPAMTGLMASRGVPLPRLSIVAGSVFQLVAGAALAAGVLVPWAAAGLALFTVAASAIAMNFWGLQGEARANAVNGWLTNVAVIGGLAMAAGTAWGD